MMIVSAVQPERCCGDLQRMGLRRDRSEIEFFSRSRFRFTRRFVVHPDTSRTIILQPPDPEVGNDGFDTPIGCQVPHDRPAVGVPFGANAVAIDLFLREQITKNPTLNDIPKVVVGLPWIGNERTIG